MEENTSYDEGLKVSLSTKDLLIYGIGRLQKLIEFFG